ncbi:MAG: molybdopterin-dependent oxidoreductase [Desulfobacter sp.]|nr:MAG: molybdopterin-dependent oxidoreductase [Desulfobacter sp.]
MTRIKIRHAVRGILLFLSLYIPLLGGAWADPGVKVMGSESAWPGFEWVGLEDLSPFAEKFRTRDPNFADEGITEYTGVRISKIIKLAGQDKDFGVTIIGADQYVGYLPGEFLDKGFLVWEMAGKPISELNGGPLKIMFKEDAGIHTSCYTWYVKALVAGPVRQAEITLIFGKEIQKFQWDALLSQAVILDRSMLSIAQGCRNEFKGLSSPEIIKAVPLSYFLSDYSLNNKIQSVQLLPFAGPSVTLGPDALDYPMFVLVSCDNQRLHPALGGPFSVVFPVEAYPALYGLVPESGALFFLEKIVVN